MATKKQPPKKSCKDSKTCKESSGQKGCSKESCQACSEKAGTEESRAIKKAC